MANMYSIAQGVFPTEEAESFLSQVTPQDMAQCAATQSTVLHLDKHETLIITGDKLSHDRKGMMKEHKLQLTI